MADIVKRLIITLITVLICSQLSAQSMTNADSLALYEGTWKYENASTHEVFIMKLSKLSYINGIFQEQFENYLGTYSYTRNNAVIFDNLSLIDKYGPASVLSVAEGRKIPISIANWIYKGETAFGFMDFVLKKTGEGEIKLISTAKGVEKISWHLHDSEGTYGTKVGEKPDYVEGFSVPTRMILTKVH